jgi:hypothetical protein
MKIKQGAASARLDQLVDELERTKGQKNDKLQSQVKWLNDLGKGKAGRALTKVLSDKALLKQIDNPKFWAEDGLEHNVALVVANGLGFMENGEPVQIISKHVTEGTSHGEPVFMKYMGFYVVNRETLRELKGFSEEKFEKAFAHLLEQVYALQTTGSTEAQQVLFKRFRRQGAYNEPDLRNVHRDTGWFG